VELFHTLNEDERHVLAERLHPAPFAKGEAMTRQGAEAHSLYIIRTIRSKAKLLLHGMKSLCYGDPSAFNIEAFGHQEEHRGLSLACGDSIQTD
jgi:hypothetical protein